MGFWVRRTQYGITLQGRQARKNRYSTITGEFGLVGCAYRAEITPSASNDSAPFKFLFDILSSRGYRPQKPWSV